MKKKNHKLLFLMGLLALVLATPARANENFEGEWVTIRELSTALDPFRRIELNIAVDGNRVVIDELFTAGRRFNAETYELNTKKKENIIPITWWSANRHIGAYIGGDKTMRIQADWVDAGQTLKLQSDYVLATQQGETPVRTYTEYRLSRDGKRLTKLELRSSRPLPIVHVFERR